MVNDAELLRRYAETGSEEAFAEFVGRHLHVVYFTALRKTGGDAALAQDVAQAVFSIAARKARFLGTHLTLTGWLYTTTRHVASRAVRKEQTRRQYEQEAAMRDLTSAEPAQEWERLRPVIDDVLDALDTREREVILIRFFEGRPFAEIGATLQISQDAARMRVERALEKVRHKLERRGIRSAAAALAAALAAQGGLAVPAGMVASVSGAAVTAGAAAGGAAALVGFMSATKISLGAAAVAVVLATGFGLVERSRAHDAESRLAAMIREQSSLQSQLARAQQGLSMAETRVAEAEGDSGALLAAVEAARVKAAATARGAAPSSAGQTPIGDDPLSRSLNALFPNGIVAIIGDKIIRVDDVRREIEPLMAKLQQDARDPDEFNLTLNQIQNQVIAELMTRILMVKEFHNPLQGAKHIAPLQVDEEIANRLQAQFGNDQTKFTAYLDSMGLTPAEFRKEVEEDIIYGYLRNQYRKLNDAKKAAKAK